MLGLTQLLTNATHQTHTTSTVLQPLQWMTGILATAAVGSLLKNVHWLSIVLTCMLVTVFLLFCTAYILAFGKDPSLLRSEKAIVDLAKLARLEKETPQGPAPAQRGIGVHIEPGAASEVVLSDFFEALDGLHRAAGGLGLKFQMDGALVRAIEVQAREVTSQ